MASSAESHSEHGPAERRTFLRADALASRERILSTAATLAGDRHGSMAEIASAAGVGRSTLYRPFPTRQTLEEALKEASRATPAAGSETAAVDGSRAPSPRASTGA